MKEYLGEYAEVSWIMVIDKDGVSYDNRKVKNFELQKGVEGKQLKIIIE